MAKPTDTAPDHAALWVAVSALVVAAVSLPIGLVALSRANDANHSSSSMTGAAASTSGMQMGMGGDMGMAEHMAPAPMQGVPNAESNRGGAPLAAHRADGVATYHLDTRPVRWSILPGVRVVAWTYNGTVPGPQLRMRYGERVRVVVKNDLPEPTTVHWHGVAVPNAMDGVPDVTQAPIRPGETFTYEFRAIPAGGDSRGGTFFYHSHFDEDRQVGLGLSGALIIDPPGSNAYPVERTVMIGEWSLDPSSGETHPAMDMAGAQPTYFTLNGKSYPANETVHVRRGQRVLMRLIGAGQFTHPMHLHGAEFWVVAVDGHPARGPANVQDTVLIGSGQRDDLVFQFARPGKWIFHCHIGHHLTNNGSSPGGLTMIFDVT